MAGQAGRMNATADGYRLAVADAARAHRAGRRSSAGVRLDIVI